ncbi:hypothetical protein, partial [Clostridioides difficile]|uniref:hypothetical protein n=1 Tax=Clostridioides difficile TaxID=1496 RepID=UPI001A9B3A25
MGVKTWMARFGVGAVHMAGAWHPKLPGFEAIEVYGPLSRDVDPATVSVELPRPGELTFKFPLAFGNGDLLHSLLLDAV